MNFSKRDTIPNLVAAINALPDSDSSCPAEFAAPAKALAIARLNAIPANPKVNAANISLRVNIIGGFQQCELQVSELYIAPAIPATPVTPA